MDRIRRGYELKTLFWGRPVRPFHLAIAISTGTIALTNLFFSGIILSGTLGDVVGVTAAISCALLFIGWWGDNDWCAEWGLLLASGAWASRATFAILVNKDEWNGILLSFAWLIGASGAYMLERYDHATRGDGE